MRKLTLVTFIAVALTSSAALAQGSGASGDIGQKGTAMGQPTSGSGMSQDGMKPKMAKTKKMKKSSKM